MPGGLADAVAISALLGLLAVAFAHPRARTEATAGVVAAAAVLAVGAVSWNGAVEQVTRLLPTMLFLAAIMVVAEVCAREGVFAAVGHLVRRTGGADPRRVLVLTFVAAAAITVVLSLDATVVLLTPAAVAAVVGTASLEPVAHVCVRLANSASLLLPVSNLTNLLVVPAVGLTFTGWVAVMAPVWLGVLVVEYLGVRLLFRSRLVTPLPGVAPDQSEEEAARRLPRTPVAVVAVMLAGFAVASTLGVEPVWVAGAAALLLVARAWRGGRMTAREAVRATHAPFLVFVLGLSVVVAALAGSFLSDAVAGLLPTGPGFLRLLGIAVVATVVANLVNNLPATLLLLPSLAPLGSTAVLAGLIGLNVGAGLTYTGSLANLLWRRTLARDHVAPSLLRFHLHAAVVTPIAVVAAVALLATGATIS